MILTCSYIYEVTFVAKPEAPEADWKGRDGGKEFVDSLGVFFSMHVGEGLSSAGPNKGMTLSECLLVEPRQGLAMFFRTRYDLYIVRSWDYVYPKGR